MSGLVAIPFGSSSSVQYGSLGTETEIRTYKVGIRFEHLGSDSSALDPTATKEASVMKKHWCLVLTPQTPTPASSARIELKRCVGNKIRFEATSVPGEHGAHPLGVWTGSLQDIKELMDSHPMNKTWAKYSAWYNNCQHWAAVMLVHLEGQSAKKPGRSFSIQHPGRYFKVLSILSSAGNTMWNKPNPLFRGATSVGLPAGVAAAGLLGVAATATVATTASITLPAAGLAGFFGATVTETIVLGTTATASATAAAIALPIVGAGVIIGGIFLLGETSDWKRDTKFQDPRRA